MPLHSGIPFDCHDCPDSTCGQSFADLDAFHAHWTRHEGKCPFPSCETPIKSKYNFGRHCARKHSGYSVEYQHVETTACKYHCGKLYSKANVSNLRRHEKTCRRKRVQQQPVNGNILSTTVEGNLCANTSEPPLNIDIQDSAPPHRSASLEDRNTHETVGPTQGLQDWRENRPTVEAIESLQRILAGGPEIDALHAFTRFLDNLGPSVHISSTSESSTLIRVSSQSDKSDDLSSVQQGVDARRITLEEAHSSNSPPDRHERMEDQQSGEEASDEEPSEEGTFGAEMTHDIQSEMVDHAFAVRSTYGCARADTLTTTKIIKTFMDSGDLNHNGFQLPSLKELNEVSNFCESFVAILASIELDLDPHIIILALVIIYELHMFHGLHLKAEHHIVGAALMLAEIISDHKLHTAVSWAEATGTPEAHVRTMKETFYKAVDELTTRERVLDRGKIVEKIPCVLAGSFNVRAECQNSSPSSLLTRIMQWRHLITSSHGCKTGWWS